MFSLCYYNGHIYSHYVFIATFTNNCPCHFFLVYQKEPNHEKLEKETVIITGNNSVTTFMRVNINWMFWLGVTKKKKLD